MLSPPVPVPSMMSPVWQKHEATIRWNLHPCTGGRGVE